MNESSTPFRRINPPELSDPPGYSQVVEVQAGRILFIAGQTSINERGELVGDGDFPTQVEQVFHNLAVALRSVGCTAANLVKQTVFLRDMDHLAVYREGRNCFCASVTSPAASAVTLVEVSRLYGPGF